MEETIALIDKIIEEHKTISQRVRALEQVVNDASALLGLDAAREDFIPGRLDDQKQSLHNWQESLEIVDQGIQAHFSREETGLLTAFEKHGGEMLASALQALLFEHRELRGRLAKLKSDVAELAAGGLSREVWGGMVWGARSYLAHTRKLLEIHAQSERELLRMLRRELVKAQKKND